jgi:hypothetical protein
MGGGQNESAHNGYLLPKRVQRQQLFHPPVSQNLWNVPEIVPEEPVKLRNPLFIICMDDEKGGSTHQAETALCSHKIDPNLHSHVIRIHKPCYQKLLV